MITALVSDFSRVILFPKEASVGSLNDLYQEVSGQAGFDFFAYYRLNSELLLYYQKLPATIERYIFTSGALQNDKQIAPILAKTFKQVISALELSTGKSSPESFKYLAVQIKQDPGQIFFVDDKLENVRAAQAAGFQAVQYISNLQLVAAIEAAMHN